MNAQQQSSRVTVHFLAGEPLTVAMTDADAAALEAALLKAIGTGSGHQLITLSRPDAVTPHSATIDTTVRSRIVVPARSIAFFEITHTSSASRAR